MTKIFLSCVLFLIFSATGQAAAVDVVRDDRGLSKRLGSDFRRLSSQGARYSMDTAAASRSKSQDFAELKYAMVEVTEVSVRISQSKAGALDLDTLLQFLKRQTSWIRIEADSLELAQWYQKYGFCIQGTRSESRDGPVYLMGLDPSGYRGYVEDFTTYYSP